ncbi:MULTISPECIES: HAD family hydrolase [unclassified Rhodococcus (in: high G+C Gram-positive bacteria)]|uniref:HAD family hydrolase n=1 Tax=unclassified Rhodococcus (in: high G+C Gram-positive bacteria) TaxID=192944 RepID=UPI000B9B3DE1|nr:MULTISPECIES: HAD family hydrolase [unclassified Rhodococcus (in: high G+C Gram-positive bacteria)]
MIDTVLVDAGGVLFNNINEETDFLDRIAHRYGANPDGLASHVRLFQRDYESDDRHVHDVLSEGLRNSGSQFNDNIDWTWVDELYLASVVPQRAVFEAILRCRSENSDIKFALVNNEAAHWDRLKNQTFRHFDLFDFACSSWLLGLVKPDLNYFDRVLSMCEADAKQCLLVDDRRDVVAAAARLGIRTFRVDSPSQIRHALKGLF